ncbi:MAG: DNRLRE domain-containing protein [Clostridia bacterium]|nr:DNRLRE domain-containing protein [Clostridia bacterium]
MKKAISVISAVLMLILAFGNAPQRIRSEQVQQAERVGIVEELRETNSDTYLLSDGSYECVVYSEDRYYKNTRGGYTEIDNTIIEAKRSDNLGDYAYKNVSSDTVFAFSGNAPSILIDTEKSDLSFVINDSRASSAVPGGAKEYAALFEYPLSGDNCIAYYDALQSTDIVYTSANGTLKEFIVLKDTNAPTSFVFDFKTEGLSAKKTTDGTVEFVDAKGEKVFELCKLFALDAAAEYTDKLNYSIAPKGKDRTQITVELSKEYFNDPSRVFPILIDPSVMITGASKTYDSYVSAAKPNENFYMANVLRTGKDSPYGVRRTFIKFNIPASVTGSITNSYIRIKKQSGVAPTMRAYRVLDGWTSGTITWNNMPGYATAQQSALATHVSNDWYKINVTDIVSYWTVGAYANNGFVLKDNTENNTSHWTTFASSEAASPNKPELHIVYSPVLESDCVYMIKRTLPKVSIFQSTAARSNSPIRTQWTADSFGMWLQTAPSIRFTQWAIKTPRPTELTNPCLKAAPAAVRRVLARPRAIIRNGPFPRWKAITDCSMPYRALRIRRLRRRLQTTIFRSSTPPMQIITQTGALKRSKPPRSTTTGAGRML